jgi:hypothetical protein
MSYNGGFYDYNDRVTQDIFFRKSAKRATKTATIKSGQVLKARSFLQSDAEGKLVAHTGFSETALVTFATITTGQTLILGGLTFTAGSGSVTAAQLVEIWRDFADGTGYADAATELLARGINATTVGTFTAGTLTGWNTQNHDAVNKVLFTSTTALTNVTDLADTGTATNPTITTVGGSTSFPKIAGVNLYDIDASSADVQAEVFTEASFWASALVWYVDTTADTITIHDGTTVACTAYNTGTVGYDKASTELLQAKFVEGSEFDNLGFLTLGEVANG